jgi:hypothetical protein
VLVAAAVCPHPPLLVPGVASGASGETDDLRAAAAAAVAELVESAPDLLVVVGASPRVGPYEPQAHGSLAPYGIDISVGTEAGAATLPLSLTLGRWLLDHHAPRVPRLLFGVPGDTEPSRCAALGATLADREARVALLAMGDGSARRSVKGPGYLDERAAPFDAEVEAALGWADAARLLALDPDLAEQLSAAGRAAWQVLAGAALARQAAGVSALSGQVSYAAAPYGVCYLVASWRIPATGASAG